MLYLFKNVKRFFIAWMWLGFRLYDLPWAWFTFQEFLVGKTAAPFVTQYHNLHHFKYRLYQRCRAKVGAGFLCHTGETAAPCLTLATTVGLQGSQLCWLPSDQLSSSPLDNNNNEILIKHEPLHQSLTLCTEKQKMSFRLAQYKFKDFFKN